MQTPVTARAIVLNADGQMLIVRRSSSDPLAPGTWDLPGGRQEPGETFTETAVREAKEETGLELQELRLFFATSAPRAGKSKTWLFFVASLPPGQTVTLGDEHDEYQWVPLQDLDRYTDYEILLRLHRYVAANPAIFDALKHFADDML